MTLPQALAFLILAGMVLAFSLDFASASVRTDLAMELTDVFVYTLNLAGMLGIDLAKTYEIVRTNNDKRFTAERMTRNGN